MKKKFVILGEPTGKGRPRFSKVGNYVKAYTPDKTVSYENLVKVEYMIQCGNYMFEKGIPLDVRIHAYYSIPQSESKKKKGMMARNELRPMKKPDMDNVVKIILDSLNKIAFYDDVQVVDCQVRKFYSNNPRVVVVIQESKPMSMAQEV